MKYVILKGGSTLELKHLSAADFTAMIIAGGDRLTANVDLINALNVFPVPDGDTGTNMNMSFVSGVENLKANPNESVGELANSLAKGLLMGARGNSGVILSQIFRGFSKAIRELHTLDATAFASAFIGGVEAAYKAVMKPVEGTILTVARESALRGEKVATQTDDIIKVMEAIVEGASLALDKTPELLPVLKQVGVVDSGGKGLLCIYEGFLAALKGEAVVDTTVHTHSGHSHAMFEDGNENPMSLEDITFGYCTEIMVRIGQGPTVKKAFDYEAFRETLNTKGDSLLVVADDEVVKVHIHTENPGEIMQLGQQFGELIKIKVDNMREQVRGLEKADAEMQQAPKEKVPYAVIAVAAGEGISEMFTQLGVSEVLSGGQTMNPSTEDFVKAIERANAEKIILLPNNKNIVMAAEQAAQVSEVPTVVVPTTTIPQGMAAMMAFNPENELDTNQVQMDAARQTVTSGQITNSIRDTEIEGVTIAKDDYLGLVNGKIVLSEADLATALHLTLEQMIDEDVEIVTIFVGEDGDTDIAESIAEQLMAQNDEVEVEIVAGKQPVYHYILSAE